MDKAVVEWKVNTPALLKEILVNDQCAILSKPLNVLGKILAQVSDRALELDDPILNGLMVRLTLYQESDMHNPEFNQELVDETMKKYNEALIKRK